MGRFLGRVLGHLDWRRCLLLAVLSGVAEETLFRGMIQPRVGLVAASLLFGLAHFVPRRALLPWTLMSVAAGFLLGWLFDVTGNLVAPVIAHAGINAVNLRFVSQRYAPS
jgi:membrane protease YdiL (CAAX protease family)